MHLVFQFSLLLFTIEEAVLCLVFQFSVLLFTIQEAVLCLVFQFFGLLLTIQEAAFNSSPGIILLTNRLTGLIGR